MRLSNRLKKLEGVLGMKNITSNIKEEDAIQAFKLFFEEGKEFSPAMSEYMQNISTNQAQKLLRSFFGEPEDL